MDDLIKLFNAGGYPLLALAISVAANIAQWRDRMRIINELVMLNRTQHDAQVKSIEVLARVETKVDKCAK